MLDGIGRWAASLIWGVLVFWAAGGASAPTQPLGDEARSRSIDARVEEALRARNLVPNDPAEDDVFLRRVYLTVVGRIPTAAEVQSFESDRRADKRDRLIDTLFDSPGRVSYEFHWWADLLRLKDRLARAVSGEPYEQWIKESLASNKPYDQMVRELLTASGPAHARGNGATGYFLRDSGMPEDNMANTARVFLGTRIECAQCHDHPYDVWKQRDFFAMAAFTGGLRYTTLQDGARRPAGYRELLADIRSTYGDRVAQQVLNRELLPSIQGISGSGTGLVRLPKDYKYADAEPLTLVKAQPLFGPSAEVSASLPDANSVRERVAKRRASKATRGRGLVDRHPDVDSREAFAAWVTSKDNPRFARTMANRLWKKVMGRGLMDAEDDIREDTVSSHPELLDELTGMLIAFDFDLVRFQKVLLRTKTWQRASEPAPLPGTEFWFPGPVADRMTAEQMWDSLGTLAVGDLDATLGRPDRRADLIYSRYDATSGKSPEELKAYLMERAAELANPAEARARIRREAQAQVAERQAVLRPKLRELRDARRKGDAARVQALEQELEALGVGADGRPTARNARNRQDLVRASELQQPAPAGHPLSVFGQSDREQIQGSHRDATVPQALELMNGLVEKQILVPGSTVFDAVSEAPTPAKKIEMAYVSVLGRAPTAAETRVWQGDLKQDPKGGSKDLLWVLINSHEFRTVR